VAPTAGRAIHVEIHGVELPGRSCGPRAGGGTYDDIHVGLKRGNDTLSLVPGDAPDATWAMDVTVRETDAGRDFGGPFISGHRDDRHLGLRWVARGPGGTPDHFRGAKLRMRDVEPTLVEEALATGRVLIGTVNLTDEHGWPRCARVRPPAIGWSLGRA
jgi:hypothetical protein